MKYFEIFWNTAKFLEVINQGILFIPITHLHVYSLGKQAQSMRFVRIMKKIEYIRAWYFLWELIMLGVTKQCFLIGSLPFLTLFVILSTWHLFKRNRQLLAARRQNANYFCFNREVSSQSTIFITIIRVQSFMASCFKTLFALVKNELNILTWRVNKRSALSNRTDIYTNCYLTGTFIFLLYFFNVYQSKHSFNLT